MKLQEGPAFGALIIGCGWPISSIIQESHLVFHF